MELSNVIVLGLATFRLAMMISMEEGPFSIFQNLRVRWGAYDYGPNGEPDTLLGRGISCPLCVGMYAAILFIVVGQLPYGLWFAAWFAVAGVQVLFQLLAKGLTNGDNE